MVSTNVPADTMATALIAKLMTPSEKAAISLWIEKGLTWTVAPFYLTFAYKNFTNAVHFPALNSFIASKACTSGIASIARSRLVLCLKTLATNSGYKQSFLSVYPDSFGLPPITTFVLQEGGVISAALLDPPVEFGLDVDLSKVGKQTSPSNKYEGGDAVVETFAELQSSEESLSKTPLPETYNLCDATEIGQKVLGTGALSIYRVIAMSPTLKLAILPKFLGHLKNKVTKLSVRAEGYTLAELLQLEFLGFTKAGKSHCSMHLDCEDCKATKIVGAILFGLDIEFEKTVSVKELRSILNG